MTRGFLCATVALINNNKEIQGFYTTLIIKKSTLRDMSLSELSLFFNELINYLTNAIL